MAFLGPWSEADSTVSVLLCLLCCLPVACPWRLLVVAQMLGAVAAASCRPGIMTKRLLQTGQQQQSSCQHTMCLTIVASTPHSGCVPAQTALLLCHCVPAAAEVCADVPTDNTPNSSGWPSSCANTAVDKTCTAPCKTGSTGGYVAKCIAADTWDVTGSCTGMSLLYMNLVRRCGTVLACGRQYSFGVWAAGQLWHVGGSTAVACGRQYSFGMRIRTTLQPAH